MDKFEKKKFGECDLDDSFFDSLKEDYQDFCSWHSRHLDRDAFVCQKNSKICALLILKDNEKEKILLKKGSLPERCRTKICTLKVSSDMRLQGLGESMLSAALEHWQKQKSQEIYITVFPKYKSLVSLLKKHGFENAGEKPKGELVYIKSKKCAGCKPYINCTKTKNKTCPKENNKTILLSIAPKYVQKIIDGTKKYEYRTKVAKENIDAIVIYCTAPVKKVVAKAQVIGILQDAPSALLDKTKDFSGVSKEFFDKYFDNKKIAYAYRLGKIEVYKKAKTLEEFGLSTAPQSFVYLKS